MTNFFYTDTSGQKFGPINDQQLQALAMRGAITSQTPLETDTGHKGVAGQIPGLFAAPTQQQIPINDNVSPSGHRKSPAVVVAKIIMAVVISICLLLAFFFQTEMAKYAKRAANSRDWLSEGYNRGEVADAAFARNCCIGVAVVVLAGGVIFLSVQRKKE